MKKFFRMIYKYLVDKGFICEHILEKAVVADLAYMGRTGLLRGKLVSRCVKCKQEVLLHSRTELEEHYRKTITEDCRRMKELFKKYGKSKKELEKIL